MWGQFISLCRPRGCTPISLILFPVPLALRWYLRSLVFIIVCLCLPEQIPPLSSGSLPPPCADIVTLTLWHARAHAHKRVSPAHSPRLGAVSFTSVLHPRTNSNLKQGGAGLDIYNQEQATSYTQTGPTCSAKTTSKKTPKPGVEVPTFILELRAKRQARPRRLVLRTVCWSSDTTNLSLRYTPVSLDIATKQSW